MEQIRVIMNSMGHITLKLIVSGRDGYFQLEEEINDIKSLLTKKEVKLMRGGDCASVMSCEPRFGSLMQMIEASEGYNEG